MLKFFFVITAIGVVFLGYPAFNEDESSSCAAYEQRVLRVISKAEGADNGLAQLLLNLAGTISSGSVVKSQLKEKYPNVPGGIGCALMYWRFIYEPQTIEKELRRAIQ